MNNSSQRLANLLKQASICNVVNLQKIFDKNEFTQLEIDSALRECISKNLTNKEENYRTCIKFLLTKIQNINFKNTKDNNTTILMYAIDIGDEISIELLLTYISKINNFNINQEDNNNENVVFHLINSSNLNMENKKKFLIYLPLSNLIKDSKNKSGKTIYDIIKEKNLNELLKILNQKLIKKQTFISSLMHKYNLRNFKELKEDLNALNLNEYLISINKNSLEFNKLLINLKYSEQIINYSIDNKKIDEFIIAPNYLEDSLCKLIFQLSKITITENNFSIGLFMNKLAMFYQIDSINDVKNLNKQLETIYFLNKNKEIFLYKSIVLIDMLLERNLINEAYKEFTKLSSEINKKEPFKSEELSKNIGFCTLKTEDTNNDISNILKMYDIFIKALFSITNNKYILKKEEDIKCYDNNEYCIKNLIKDLLKIDTKNNSQKIKDFHKLLYYRLIYYEERIYPNKLPEELLSNNYSIPYCDKIINDENNEFNIIYLLNYHGIENLKLGNYSLSSIYFLKCLNLISKKTSLQLIKRNHFYPSVIYNLSLSYFYTKRYKETIKLLYILLNYSNNKYKYFTKYKYIYYRFGLAELELTLNSNKDNFDNNCNNKNKNSTYHSTYKYYKGKVFILKSKKNIEKLIIPSTVLYNFKKVLLLIKNNPEDNLYFPSIINLIFCLIINEDYNQALLYLKNCKCINENQQNIKNSYLMQCYLNLNLITKAKAITTNLNLNISESNPDHNNNEIKNSSLFFEKVNQKLVNINNKKLPLLTDLVNLNIKENKRKDIEKYLLCILNSVNFNASHNKTEKLNKYEELPSYIINVFVYYYLYLGKKDIAIDILKSRKVKRILINDNK